MLDKLTHAGGLVVRESGGKLEVLIIRPNDGTQSWVLPKGHIERGESPAEAAGREVAEESGVLATVERLLDHVEFTAKGENVRAAFYLMRARGEQPPKENRAVRWVSTGDAARLLTHAQSRHVLEAALPHLAKR